jgi:hypothetical protein
MTSTLSPTADTADIAELSEADGSDRPRVLLAVRPSDRAVAADLVRSGAIIGASFASVFGLVGDGMRPALGYDMATIKGRAQLGHPLAVSVPSTRLSQLIDLAQVHPALRRWALDGPGLSSTVAARCYLRVPIRESVARTLPPHLLSHVDGVPYLQSVDPNGMSGISEFMTMLWQSGVEFPAVTSMNQIGRPGLIDFDPALRFATDAGLAAVLLGPGHRHSRGPLSILALGPCGLSVARVGTFSADELQRTIGVPIGGCAISS